MTFFRDLYKRLDDMSDQWRAVYIITYSLSALFVFYLISLVHFWWLQLLLLVCIVGVAAVCIRVFWQSRQVPVKPVTPPRPSRPPNISDDTQQIPCVTSNTENVPLYRNRFSIVPLVATITTIVLLWILLVYLCIFQGNAALWCICAILTVIAVFFCYYKCLVWNGEEFIVNEEWYERPRMMPSPFTSTTQAVRRHEIGSYRLRQTFLDKLCRTCQLRSDTASTGDDAFHVVKWLKYPDELRKATGISAPRKNRFLFFRK